MKLQLHASSIKLLELIGIVIKRDSLALADLAIVLLPAELCNQACSERVTNKSHLRESILYA